MYVVLTGNFCSYTFGGGSTGIATVLPYNAHASPSCLDITKSTAAPPTTVVPPFPAKRDAASLWDISSDESMVHVGASNTRRRSPNDSRGSYPLHHFDLDHSRFPADYLAAIGIHRSTSYARLASIATACNISKTV